jgi:predicted DNA-binding protein
VRHVGRPTTGLQGEKASEYRRFTLRLPDHTSERLSAISRTVNRPAWRVIVDAIAAYLGEGPELTVEQRRAARALLRLEQ